MESPPNPPPFLPPNDLELLRFLAKDFLLLSRQQVNALFPERSLRNINYRLSKLRSAGFLSRRQYPATTLGPWMPLYYLGPRAPEALGHDPGDVTLVARRKRAIQLRESAIPHSLLVDSVHIQFLTATKDYPDYELLTWIPQYDALWRTLGDHGFQLRPDGYAEIHKDAHVVRFFLELDRGTERGQKITAKFAEYQRYLMTGQFEQHFSAPSFRVLFVTSTERRARQLARHASSFSENLFWLSSIDTFFSSPLFNAFWRVSGSDLLQPLSLPL